MSRPKVFSCGSPYVGNGGCGFTPFHWRADKPSGKIAIPEGPQVPREIPPAPLPPARQATANNRAAHDAALAPRRYRPPNQDQANETDR